jgi:hypothetical protein
MPLFRLILFALLVAMHLPAHNVPWLHGNVPDDGDGDGMPDAWETQYALNPNFRGDAERDTDLDGFSNVEEFRGQTNPNDASVHPDWFTKLYVRELKGKQVRITLVDDLLDTKGGVFEFSGKIYTTDGLMKDGIRVKVKDLEKTLLLPAQSRRLASDINRRVRSSAPKTP